MREIKFKAWDKKNKQWVTNKIGIWGGDIIIYDRDAGDDGILAFRHKTESCYPEKCWDEVEIVQYTGLKDKDGKEIYEGDILICVEMHDGNCFCNAWENIKGGAKPIPKTIKRISPIRWDIPCDISNSPHYWKIIGSMWENPELLQEDK